MSVQVVVLHSAELDLKALKAYLGKQFGKESWLTSYGKIKASVDSLKTFPLSGVVPEELESLGLSQYRQIISGMNRIIYEIRGDMIFIHAICDTRRDMKSLLHRRLFRGGPA